MSRSDARAVPPTAKLPYRNIVMSNSVTVSWLNVQHCEIHALRFLDADDLDAAVGHDVGRLRWANVGYGCVFKNIAFLRRFRSGL